MAKKTRARHSKSTVRATSAKKRSDARSSPREKKLSRPASRRAPRPGAPLSRKSAPKRPSVSRPASRVPASVGARPERPGRASQSRLPRDELLRIREWLDRKRRALKDHIQAELTELENRERKHRTDLEEIASDTHDADPLCEIMGMESVQLDQIERAIHQIDSGTYGICEECGGQIPLARLQALPFATQCIECKRRSEGAGSVPGAASRVL